MRKIKMLITLIILLMLISIFICITVGNPLTCISSLLFNDSDEVVDVIETADEYYNNNEPELRDTILYYKDKNGLLVPVMRKIPWSEGKGIAKTSLRAMIDTTANRADMENIGLIPVIPANTEILGMTIKDGLCKVDFSNAFTNVSSKSDEESLIKAVVYTLTEFETVDTVQFMIEGKIVENMTYGTNIEMPLRRENINYIGSQPSKNTVLVYYENETVNDDSLLVPVTKPIEIIDDKDANILDVLDNLIAGPPQGLGLKSQIPKDTKVLGIKINDSIAEVHLSEEILKIKGNYKALNKSAESIALTVKEHYSDIAGIKLFAGGKVMNLGENEKKDILHITTFVNQY